MSRKKVFPPIEFGRKRSIRFQIDIDAMLVERAKKQKMTVSRLVRDIIEDNLLYHKELEQK